MVGFSGWGGNHRLFVSPDAQGERRGSRALGGNERNGDRAPQSATAARETAWRQGKFEAREGSSAAGWARVACAAGPAGTKLGGGLFGDRPGGKITERLLVFPTERDVILRFLVESIHSN